MEPILETFAVTAAATLLHVDFFRIQKGVAVDVEVPLHLMGTPEGVRLGGGKLEQIIYDLPLRCVPSKIPEVIEVDISGLDVGEVLHISDISFDEGIEVTVAQERTICSVAAPMRGCFFTFLHTDS